MIVQRCTFASLRHVPMPPTARGRLRRLHLHSLGASWPHSPLDLQLHGFQKQHAAATKHSHHPCIPASAAGSSSYCERATPRQDTLGDAGFASTTTLANTLVRPSLHKWLRLCSRAIFPAASRPLMTTATAFGAPTTALLCSAEMGLAAPLVESSSSSSARRRSSRCPC